MRCLGVAWGGMKFRGLSDADIEALIAGELVAGTPELSALVGALRGEFDVTPTVQVRTALGEFIDVLDVRTSTVPSSAGNGGGLAAKAAAVFGAVSVKVLLGAALAAASVGGAHVLGFVDVPGLPDKAPTARVEIPVPALDAPVENPAAVEQVEIQPTRQTDLPQQPSASAGAVVERGTGCEFSQETVETRSREATEQGRADGLPIGPCDVDQAPSHTLPDQARKDLRGPPADVPSGPPAEIVPPGRTPRGG